MFRIRFESGPPSPSDVRYGGKRVFAPGRTRITQPPLRRPSRRQPTPLETILVAGSTYSRGHLKERLFAAGVTHRRCESCGQDERWRGRRMALILDHVNGVADDHRLENLRILCPNCAATLETHCGRKNRLTFEARGPARGAPRRSFRDTGTSATAPRPVAGAGIGTACRDRRPPCRASAAGAAAPKSPLLAMKAWAARTASAPTPCANGSAPEHRPIVRERGIRASP